MLIKEIHNIDILENQEKVQEKHQLRKKKNGEINQNGECANVLQSGHWEALFLFF